jgi:hypothetical protein
MTTPDDVEHVVRAAQSGTLRAYADRWHGHVEGIAQSVDYGTGVEYDAVCQCGMPLFGDDGPGGCGERAQLLADADALDAGEPYRDISEPDEKPLPSIHSPEHAATQPHAMVDDDGCFWYPDSPDDAAYFAKHHGARPLNPDAFRNAFTEAPTPP